MLSTLNNKANTYTLFVPNNNAMKVFINAISGGLVPLTAPDAVFSAFITANIPVATAAAIVMYNTVPQSINFGTLTGAFPNFQYPSILNPAPQVSALLRLTTFPSNRNGNFVNNVPVISTAKNAANGSFYEVAALVAPPQQFLWDRINTDADLTYFKAAIERADADPFFTRYHKFIKQYWRKLYCICSYQRCYPASAFWCYLQGLLAMGVDQATAFAQATALASTPAGFNVLPTQTVLGLVLYHILFADPKTGSRAFTNNFPTTLTNYTTLLNMGVPVHPGVGLQATFLTAPPFVTATVKGAVNATASNIVINPFPNGSSDQHYINGVLHKIDQVLLPQ